jgi:DNA-binding LytR/AlgR family response regulator
MNLSVLAVDDERPALQDLERLLRSCEGVGEVVGARSGGEALRRLAERRFDALFVDVRMPELDGIELAGVLERFAAPPAVVFVSAYEDAALSAFEVHAIDYLMKPVSRQRIEEALARVARRHEGPAETNGEEIVAVESARGGATHLLQRSSILYVEAHGDYVRIHSAHGRFLRRGTLAEIERRWSAHGFVRVHRGYLVNLRRAVEIRPKLGSTAIIVLSDGTRIPVARRQVADLRRHLGM